VEKKLTSKLTKFLCRKHINQKPKSESGHTVSLRGRVPARVEQYLLNEEEKDGQK